MKKTRIMVVEDEGITAMRIKKSLEDVGHSVTSTEFTGEDAVKKFMQYKESVDLLLTDVIMPKKDGKAVYVSIKAIKPQIKALFMSGYTADRTPF